ncbi:BsuBI/PstI family type II restriction endonuclease [uncultured Duncaniella sp.]|uniref:BsuBI/PstI family type II restriction endonuclease n=1 Tax=uncultured Duncaniella sp. TaxID=2768039 RepID=UPI0026337669|nr:BsuBI/PstI family type II restriction endonuclease [uncultured Duncaniella sp.]
MDKLEYAKGLLNQIGMPQKQQGVLCALALLAMAGLKRESQWSDATNEWMRIHDIMRFIADNYDVIYAENSRETFRKQAMHPFRTAALIEDNGMSTNSPNYRYRITNEFLNVIKEVKEDSSCAAEPGMALTMFISNHESLSQIYASKKKMQKMPVRINHQDFTFSPGKHNELQKAIIEEFAPRFAPNSECLYVGDTIQKDLVKNVEKLSDLGFEITLHDKMPDVVLYREDKNWIYFIESITSVGPMDPKRIVEIEAMTRNVTAGKIFISAFLDFSTFKKFSDKLAWETEVWIADMPDHMIHLNGDKFMGPRNK